MIHRKYIAIARTRPLHGFYGYGKSKQEAVNKLRAAAKGEKDKATRVMVIWCVESDKPFAPVDRPAKVHEAEAYVDREGALVTKDVTRKFQLDLGTEENAWLKDKATWTRKRIKRKEPR